MITENEKKTSETKISPEQAGDSTPSREELHATKEGQIAERGRDRLRSPEFPITIDARTEEELKNHFEKLSKELERTRKLLETLSKIEQGGEIVVKSEPTVRSSDVDKWVEQLVAGTHDASQQEYYELSKERERLRILTSTYEISREELAKRAEAHGIEFSSLRSRLPGLGGRHLEEVSSQVFEREQAQLMATYDKQEALKKDLSTAHETAKLLPEPKPTLVTEGYGLQQIEYLDADDPQEILDSLDSLNKTRAQNRHKLEGELFGDGEKVSEIVASLANLPLEQREAMARAEIEKLLQRHKITVDDDRSELTTKLPKILQQFHKQVEANFGSGYFRSPSLVSETLPIMYMDERDETELQRLADTYKAVSGESLWGYQYNENHEELGYTSAAEFVKGQRDKFIKEILLGETPFIHTTPVLERIVRAGALKPKQMVEEEQRYHNMTGSGSNPEGTHSNLVHFCPDTFNPYWAHFSSDKDVYKSKRDPEKMEYQGGIAVPLSEVVKHSPISMYGVEAIGTDYVSIELPVDLEGVPPEFIARIRQEEDRLDDPDVVTTSNGMDRSLDWAFVSSEDPTQAAGYEYPLDESYIFTTDAERTSQDLLEAGKDQGWIDEHVLELPADLRNFGAPGNETELSRIVSQRARAAKTRRTVVVPIRRITTSFNERGLYQYRR